MEYRLLKWVCSDKYLSALGEDGEEKQMKVIATVGTKVQWKLQILSEALKPISITGKIKVSWKSEAIDLNSANGIHSFM